MGGRFRRRPVVLMGVVLVIFLAGCGDESPGISLPETPILSGQNRYLLVIDPYVRVYSTPARSGEISFQLRRGDVLAVSGRSPDGTWIEVRQLDIQGWVERGSVRTFSSREQALNARRTLDEELD